MKKITKDELDYFLSKINFGASSLDAKAIEMMNRLDTLCEVEDSKQVEVAKTSELDKLKKKFGNEAIIDVVLICQSQDELDAMVNFVEYRKQVKKPIKTARPIRQFILELKAIVKAGYDIHEAIEVMKNAEWQTIKLDWIKKILSTKKSGADLAQFGFGANSTQEQLK